MGAVTGDEHVRYEQYRRMLEGGRVRPEELVRLALSDPEPAMGRAAAADVVEAVARGSESTRAFDEWVSTLPADSHLAGRIEGHRLLLRLDHGEPVGPDELVAAPDWVQRRAVEVATDQGTLAALAGGAGTRRVRNRAASRLGAGRGG